MAQPSSMNSKHRSMIVVNVLDYSALTPTVLFMGSFSSVEMVNCLMFLHILIVVRWLSLIIRNMTSCHCTATLMSLFKPNSLWRGLEVCGVVFVPLFWAHVKKEFAGTSVPFWGEIYFEWRKAKFEQTKFIAACKKCISMFAIIHTHTITAPLASVAFSPQNATLVLANLFTCAQIFLRALRVVAQK